MTALLCFLIGVSHPDGMPKQRLQDCDRCRLVPTATPAFGIAASSLLRARFALVRAGVAPERPPERTERKVAALREVTRHRQRDPIDVIAAEHAVARADRTLRQVPHALRGGLNMVVDG